MAENVNGTLYLYRNGMRRPPINMRNSLTNELFGVAVVVAVTAAKEETENTDKKSPKVS